MMAIMNKFGYLTRGVNGTRHATIRKDWWLVKYSEDMRHGYIQVRGVNLPPSLIGRKIKLRIEVLRNGKNARYLDYYPGEHKTKRKAKDKLESDIKREQP